MNKQKTLESIHLAREAHQSQMRKITALLDGERVNNPVAVLKTECAFGKWLYAGDSNLKRVLGALFYENIVTIHGKWHEEYTRLFKIFFSNEKKQGFFSKMIGGSSANEMDIDKAKLYYSELAATTEKLLRALDSCERRLTALNESKFI